MMTIGFRNFALLLSVCVLGWELSGCADSHDVGCISDDECRYGRICDLQMSACVDGARGVGDEVDAGMGASDSGDQEELQQQRIEQFLGHWDMTVNGSRSTRGGSNFFYDLSWRATIERGESHDLVVKFGGTSNMRQVSELFAACPISADLTADGFELITTPCRHGSERLDEIRGTGWFDDFGALSINLQGEGVALTGQQSFIYDLRLYSTP